MFMVKISVIVPVYNCQDDLKEALDSILYQEMIDDIEVIMIDDGSSDNSKYIIRDYDFDHENFHAFHTPHMGVNNARNFGISQATGEYIHFMDSDDYVHRNAFRKLYDLAKKHDHDVVIGKSLRFNGGRCWEIDIPKYVYENLDGTVESTTFAENVRLTWDMFLWNKLYKRSFLEENNIRFPDENLTFQDNLFSIQVFAHSNTIGILDDYVYFWRKRASESSITQKIHMKWATDRITILKMVHEFVSKNIDDEELLYNKYLKWLILDLPNFIGRISEFPEDDHQFLFDSVYDIVNLVPERFLSNLNSYYSLLYEMVKNRDWDDLMALSSANLKNKPNNKPDISAKYEGRLNLSEDAQNEQMNANFKSAEIKDGKIIIGYRLSIPFYADMGKHDELKFACINSKTSEIIYESDIGDDKIAVPLDAFESKDCIIRISYANGKIKKDAFLKTKTIKDFNLNDNYIKCGFDESELLHLSNFKKGNLEIKIDNVSFDGAKLSFEGTSSDNLEKIKLEDVISYNEFEYDVQENAGKISFEIDYDDLKNTPIKRWELRPDTRFKSMKSKKCTFYDEQFTIKVESKRNIIIIELVRFNFNELKELITRNEQLTKENRELKKTIEQYKSRKDVALVNKVKGIFK